MGQSKKMVMAILDDDMSDFSYIPEMELVNKILDRGFASEYPDVPEVEGLSDECSE